MDKDKLLAKVCSLLMSAIGGLLACEPWLGEIFVCELTDDEKKVIIEEAMKYDETECE